MADMLLFMVRICAYVVFALVIHVTAAGMSYLGAIIIPPTKALAHRGVD